jgi:hypothetical protein
MTDHRVDWIETFTSMVQFYPKLSATIALSTMAAASRMIPIIRPMADVIEEAPPLIKATPAKRVAKKAKPARKATKRVNGRR